MNPNGSALPAALRSWCVSPGDVYAASPTPTAYTCGPSWISPVPRRPTTACSWRWCSRVVHPPGSTSKQGLTLAHFKAQLEDLRDTSLTLELNLSTFGPHPRVKLAYMGDEVHLS